MGIFDRLFGKRKKKTRKPVKGQRPRPAAQQKARPEEPSHPLMVRPAATSVPALVYFEVPRPEGDGICSDGACSCKRAVIARGNGYLYVSQEAVDFRNDAQSVAAAQAKANRVRMQMSNMAEAAAVIHGRTTAVLLCQQAAEGKCLDLVVAAADARHWWDTGMAPLRATPVAPVAEKKSRGTRSTEMVAEKPKTKAKKPRTKKSSESTDKKKT
jgi:hypothetical protein